MTTRVEIKPDILSRAIERAGFGLDDFLFNNPKVDQWVSGEKLPTVKQLENFAKKVRIPFGYLLLDELPKEKVPIPFFRTGKGITDQVSLNIYDTILLLKNRQSWLSDYLDDNGYDPLPFVGKYTANADVNEIVTDIRTTLGLPENWAQSCRNWEAALSKLTAAIEEAGIVVTFNGVVGNNTKRPIEPSECRGFVLVDEFVPFLFVNNKDAKAAQMFTLMHELVHIWLGFSAGFDNARMLPVEHPIELLCDRAAAEFLVPARLFREAWGETQDFRTLARRFKVSPIVIGRRAMDLGLIGKGRFFQFYRQYMARLAAKTERKKDDSGGDFFATARKRVSPRFAGFINQALKQRQITHLDAYRLTGLKGKTFQAFMEKTL